MIYQYESINEDDDDSSEIKFMNPYLILGVENIVLYGEFQNKKNIKMFVEQDSDGLLPVYLMKESPAPPLNETIHI